VEFVSDMNNVELFGDSGRKVKDVLEKAKYVVEIAWEKQVTVKKLNQWLC
jgi:uncharacterized protein (DUF2344 family)